MPKKIKKSLHKKEGNIPELLAPAGTKEAFFAALEAGADAIYVGPRILNARAYGKNFSVKQIAGLTQAAHNKGVKLFVALNSVMKEHEIPQAVKLLSQLHEIGIDALITQDLGILRLARRYFPELRLHASTLMTIHNSLGAETCKRLGFSRVVLARELTLKEIARISDRVSIELELFVHGAMCFSISGLCRFSSFFGGKSSTRGRCVQPCRRLYKWEGRKGTFFSMEDLSALELIPALSRLGISSLKIEGRLKPANYVYHVVRAYRIILDSDRERFEADLIRANEEIQKAMGRPTTNGFYLSSNPRDLICPTRTANTGLFMGKVVSYEKSGVMEVDGKKSFSKGDTLRIVIKDRDKQFSVKVDSISEKGTIVLRQGAVPNDMRDVLCGALVFKSDTKRSEREKWLSDIPAIPGISKAMRRAKTNAERILSEIEGGHTQERTKGLEPRVVFFLRDFSQFKEHSGKRGGLDIILPLSRGNLNKALRLPRKDLNRTRIIWHLPCICFEQNVPELISLVRLARNKGFHRFQISNLGHLSLPLKGAKLTSSYEFNILNSQALFLMNELGVLQPQFSIETDLKNLKMATRRFTREISLTVYGYVPIFTTRLRHKTFSSKKPVESQRGEQFFWRPKGDHGLLYPKQPISFLDLGTTLLKHGVTNWIVDLRFNPGKKPKRQRLPSSWRGLKGLFRGRKFNMDSHLH